MSSPILVFRQVLCGHITKPLRLASDKTNLSSSTRDKTSHQSVIRSMCVCVWGGGRLRYSSLGNAWSVIIHHILDIPDVKLTLILSSVFHQRQTCFHRGIFQGSYAVGGGVGGCHVIVKML